MSGLTVITGGGGGIGAATAEQLLAETDDSAVALLDIRPGRAGELASTYPGRVTLIETDTTRPESVDAAFERIDSLPYDLDGLVNGAGTVDNTPSIDLSHETWAGILATNLDSALLCSQAAARRMLETRRGAIVNVASIAGLFGHPRRLPYSVAKAGVIQLTRTLAVEWAQQGVRVNVVLPGYIETPILTETVRIGLIDREAAGELHAMKRLGRPEEIASAISFLLSERASFITGEDLRVDGGFSVLKAP